MEKGGWVYLMTDKPRGVLYVGVTADLARRVGEHQAGVGSVFCARWGLRRLVWAERFGSIEAATRREKQVKRWRRDWKIALVEAGNPEWGEILPW
ncbi:MAG: GIY-YIG nuclease family protein [Polymorphobacter sp.]|uniref:GIY-YIG nuclease family protein n=1 Tax=Polymorphobacter sp. TaxID=1909290 RepID=UPI003A8C538B